MSWEVSSPWDGFQDSQGGPVFEPVSCVLILVVGGFSQGAEKGEAEGRRRVVQFARRGGKAQSRAEAAAGFAQLALRRWRPGRLLAACLGEAVEFRDAGREVKEESPDFAHYHPGSGVRADSFCRVACPCGAGGVFQGMTGAPTRCCDPPVHVAEDRALCLQLKTLSCIAGRGSSREFGLRLGAGAKRCHFPKPCRTCRCSGR